jgi:hypothetical protein
VDQGGIARSVAMSIVDGLEPVDVEVQQAAGGAVALDVFDRARQIAQERAPIADRRQRILVREPLQLQQPALRREQLVAQVGDLIDQMPERRAYLRREFVRGQAQQADRVVRTCVRGIVDHGSRAAHLAPERAQERQEFLVADLHVSDCQRTDAHAAMVSPKDVSAG